MYVLYGEKKEKGNRMYRVGIDLGGTNIKVGIVDEKQNLIRQSFAPTEAKRPAEEVIKDMADQVKKVLAEEKLSLIDIEGIGIGCAGTIDAKHGTVPYSNNLAWENVPLADLMKKYLDADCTIRVSNDANCAALGEAKAGAARGIDNVVLLTLGTGVGGGVIIDGKIFEGAHAGGAELGHTSLILGGRQCTCGRRGCVECYVSANGLIRSAQEAAEKNPQSLLNRMCGDDLEKMNGKIPFDAMQQQDEAAIAVVQQYIAYLTESIANFVNLFRPDMVLLSGGICNQGENLTDPINENLAKLCFAGEKAFVPQVQCASLGNLAGIIGAANLLDM